MRVIAVALVLAALLAASCARAATQGSRPTLRIASDKPFVVVGTGFRSGERVKLLVSTPKPDVRTVRAGSRGRFRLVLRVALPWCGGALVVQAIGAHGSRATVDRSAPDCAPTD
jgi:hypothetical protein